MIIIPSIFFIIFVLFRFKKSQNYVKTAGFNAFLICLVFLLIYLHSKMVNSSLSPISLIASLLVLLLFNFFHARKIMAHKQYLDLLNSDFDHLNKKEKDTADIEKKFQDGIHELNTKLEETSSIYNATLSMSSILDFREILHSFLKSIGNVDGFKSLNLVITLPSENETGQKMVSYYYGSIKKTVEEYPTGKEEEVIFERMRKERNIHFVEDCSAFEVLENSFNISKTNKVLVVPLYFQNDYYGALIYFNELSVNIEQIELLAFHFSIEIHKAQLYEKIKHLSTIDTLSGAYLKRHFFPRFEDEINRNKAFSKELGLLMIDIDRFKQINDKYGHISGDSVIRRVGKIIKSRCREEDLICRFGGDEFVIVLPKTPKEQTHQVALRIKKSINDLVFYQGTKNEFKITVSMGLAIFPEDGDTPQKLLEAVDAAMYFSKKSGRDRITLSGFDSKISDEEISTTGKL